MTWPLAASSSSPTTTAAPRPPPPDRRPTRPDPLSTPQHSLPRLCTTAEINTENPPARGRSAAAAPAHDANWSRPMSHPHPELGQPPELPEGALRVTPLGGLGEI